MLDRNELLEKITEEDVINILTEIGEGSCKREGSNLAFSTYNCHGGNSNRKLWYYPESHTFKCWTCNESKSLYDIIGGLLNLDFSKSFLWLANWKGININHRRVGMGRREKVNEELKFLKLHSYRPTKVAIDLPSYNDKVLRNFDFIVSEDWWNEGINSEEVLEQFEICFDVINRYQLIPHRSPTGDLCGIIRRSWYLKDLDNGCKYLPYEWGGTVYKYNKRNNLYGYWQNKEVIKKNKKCILWESEKSTLHYGSIYGKDKNISLSLGSMNFTNIQRDLLIDLGIEEVVIALDKQWEQELIESNDKSDKVFKAKKEFNNYFKNILKIYKMLKNYCTVSVILDWEGKLDYKDAPIDKGKSVFEELYKGRYVIELEEDVEEIFVRNENGNII